MELNLNSRKSSYISSETSLTLVKRITNIIKEILAFSQGLATSLEITDAPQIKNHWSRRMYYLYGSKIKCDTDN